MGGLCEGCLLSGFPRQLVSVAERPIPLTDMNAFSSTHYHIPDVAIEKAPPEQQVCEWTGFASASCLILDLGQS